MGVSIFGLLIVAVFCGLAIGAMAIGAYFLFFRSRSSGAVPEGFPVGTCFHCAEPIMKDMRACPKCNARVPL